VLALIYGYMSQGSFCPYTYQDQHSRSLKAPTHARAVGKMDSRLEF